MGKKGHTEEEILRALREAESGDTVVEICRKHGIRQQTFYLWRKKYASLDLALYDRTPAEFAASWAIHALHQSVALGTHLGYCTCKSARQHGPNRTAPEFPIVFGSVFQGGSFTRELQFPLKETSGSRVNSRSAASEFTETTTLKRRPRSEGEFQLCLVRREGKAP